MGCFLACFGDSKRRKQPRKSPVEISPSNHVFKASGGVCALEQTKEVVEVPSVDLNKDTLEKLGEQIELCHTTEKTSEPIIEDNKVGPTEENENNLDEIKKEEKSEREDESWGSSNLSQAFSLPLNHRYENCSNSDDDDEYVEEMDRLDEEDEEEEGKDDTNADDGHGQSKLLMKQESSESLFSLSFGSRKQVCTVEAAENEVNSPDLSLSHRPDNASSDKKTGCWNENVSSVLNPIENVTHCLIASKVKTLPSVHHLEKENISLDKGCDVLIRPEPTFRAMRKSKENRSNLKHVEDEIAVDTSLSNWLVESETTPKSKSSTSSIGNSPMWTRNSAKSYEDRPILGGLTLKELRQFSAFSTPRRSRSRSPEEMPIIGTVGSYWSHTGQDADSNPGSSCKGPRKCREDERVNWNSTPFLERLDMALASNSAEV